MIRHTARVKPRSFNHYWLAFASSKFYSWAMSVFRLSALTTTMTATLGGLPPGHAR